MLQVEICTAVILMLCAADVLGDSHGGSGANKAMCKMESNSGKMDYPVQGVITFVQMQEGGNVSIEVDLSGFNTTDGYEYHGFHVHQTGKTGNGCKDAEGHFNPHAMRHGGPTSQTRHVGDLGNLYENGSSTIRITFTDHMIKLHGVNNIIGRAMVLHAKMDDYGKMNNTGSWSTGNAGARLGCCVIKEVMVTDNADNMKTNTLVVFFGLCLWNLLTWL